MDKNEIITLSSDEECDISDKPETSKIPKPGLQNSPEVIRQCLEKFKQISVDTEKGIIFCNNKHDLQIVRVPKLPEKRQKLISDKSPEIVVLDGTSAKTVEDGLDQLNHSNNNSPKRDKNHSGIDVIDIVEVPNDDNLESSTGITEDVSNNAINKASEQKITNKKSQIESPEESDKDSPDQNLKSFTEFVEFCGCLEEILSDRARLTKKLMKRYGEADSYYIKSQEFQNLIKKCRTKVNKNNLYLIAKEITDELSFRKKLESNTGKSNAAEGECQRNQQTAENNETPKDSDKNSKQSKKKTKVLKKIVEKLDKLGARIRELEQKEVDLSDEEESSYIQLQRYRERFWQIYTRLCKYTNEVVDAERVYNRRICFTESKYPAINKCIENYLNKTRQFPDFSDIMRLLVSQSSSLGLPSNKESIREIAIQIFQQVGVMLQRRRKYDLWDSFCGFLDEGIDPADNDPLLDRVLKNNFEIRIKKEQEIFQHYTELQEKERLEPEEVPDEEANRSPVESGNEDEKEIEDIENSLIKRLDDEFKEEPEDNDLNDSEIKSATCKTSKKDDDLTKAKETKNNYKNCKSLKWKLENGLKGKNENINPEDSNLGAENEEKEGNSELQASGNRMVEPKQENKLVQTASSEKGIHNKSITEAAHYFDSPSKRRESVNKEDDVPKKKMCTDRNEMEGNGFDIFEIDGDFEKKRNKVFEVRCCQIVPDNVFEDLTQSKNDWGKRKVFRDLTNVNRLMELHGRKRKMSGLYSPSFFHRSFFDFEKASWKKRFKVSFKLMGLKGEKCALSGEDKTGKTVNSNSGGDEKVSENNCERTGGDDKGGNTFSSAGNGNEEDNNEDENKKNGKSGDEHNENQHEDDDEEENENEEDSQIEAESSEHLFPTEKTEETPGDKSPSTNDRDDESHLFYASTDESFENKKNDESFEKKSEDESLKTKRGDESFENKRENEETKNSDNPGTQKETELLCSKETVECIIRELPERKDEMVENINSKIENEEMNAVGECISELEPKVYIIESELEEVEKPQKEATEVILDEKPKDMQVKAQSPVKKLNKGNEKEISKEINTRVSLGKKRRKVPVKTSKPFFIETRTSERKKRQVTESRQIPLKKSVQVDSPGQTPNRRNTPSTSDEERVKRFLLHSPSSISITPPRKLTLSKPPSQAALQALATLRNLKGISATIVRGSQSKSEDDVVVVEDSWRRRGDQTPNSRKRRRNDMPVISSIQSVDSTTPKIVTVQGNVSGFENFWPETPNNGNSQCDSSSIRISNVWGSLPNNYTEARQNNVESLTPSCSFRQNNPGSSNAVKKKATKKTVEYVVLD